MSKHQEEAKGDVEAKGETGNTSVELGTSVLKGFLRAAEKTGWWPQAANTPV